MTAVFLAGQLIKAFKGKGLVDPGRVLGIEAAALLDKLHFLSAGIVSFSRGLNDTPKIAAMLLVAPAFTGLSACVAVGILIAVGGLISARRVAETMSQLGHDPAFGRSARLCCLSMAPKNLAVKFVAKSAARSPLPC